MPETRADVLTLGSFCTFRGPLLGRVTPLCHPAHDFASGKYSFPLTPARSLNLAPGEHHLLIGDNQNSASKDQGIVTTEAGKTATLTCSETGCIGLRHP
ncbi:MAG: hypothetical protein AB8H79_06705 [Myxococcota bacterium]